MVETVVVDQPSNRIFVVGFEEVELFGDAGRCVALVAAIQTAIGFMLNTKLQSYTHTKSQPIPLVRHGKIVNILQYVLHKATIMHEEMISAIIHLEY